MAGAVAAAPLEDVGRSLAARYADAVVPVMAVLKIEIPGEESRSQEQTVETYGTVVATNGLTVLSALSLNPLAGVSAMEMNIGGRASSVTPRSSVSQIRVRMHDGAEVPMRQVLRDEDLDLAFLAPDPAGGRPAPAFPTTVPFDRPASAKAMDEVLGLGRAGKLFNWAPAVGVSRIIARVEKPRIVYLFSAGFVGGVGTPVFTADGVPLGVVAMRRQPGGGRGTLMQQAAVIVPAEDVADLIRQAIAAAAKARSEPSS